MDYFIKHFCAATGEEVRTVLIDGEPYFYVYDILDLFNIRPHEFDPSVCETIIRIANVDSDKNSMLVTDEGLDNLLEYIVDKKCDYYSLKWLLVNIVPAAHDYAEDAAEEHSKFNTVGNNIAKQEGQLAKPTVIIKQLKQDDTNASKTH